MKPTLTLAAVLALAAPVAAEYRPVLIVVTHDTDRNARVAVHSDDKADRRTGATVEEAGNALKEMKGWGSTVGVFVVTDGTLARKDRRALFDAIDGNVWLDLSYYGPDTPKNLADHFLKPEPAPAPRKAAEPEPVTKVADRDHAVRIALAHLNIARVTKEPSEAFNLRVAEEKLTRGDLKTLDDPRHGITKHKDFAGLPEHFPVFRIHLQHGLSGDSTVFVTKDGGRVILVKFAPEG